jgi:hypothetical protein
MTSFSGPLVGEVATGSSSSAAIDIPKTKGCRGGCTCDCGCVNCSCHSRVDIVDPNREEYGGEGTRLDIGAHAITQPTSYLSTGSMRSVKESSDAPAPTANATTAAPQSFDTIRDLHGGQDRTRLAQNKMDRFMNEPDDDCPWEHFLEKDFTSDAMEDDSGAFGPMEVDGSMRNRAPFSNGERSMLSSFMSSLSLHTPSAGKSDIVLGVGGVFGPRGGSGSGHSYLRLLD